MTVILFALLVLPVWVGWMITTPEKKAELKDILARRPKWRGYQ